MDFTSVRNEITSWLETLSALVAGGKIAKEAYDVLVNRINALEADVNELEAGAGFIEDAELAVEIPVEVAEIAAAVAAVAV